MQAVIIAAGESSRFWPLNQGHKSQVKLLGKPIIAWTIKGLAENNITDIIVVHGAESTIPAELGDGKDLGCTIFYVPQERPLGTGNALWQARDLVRGPFLVVWPSKVNTKTMVEAMLLKQQQEGADMVMVGTETATPWDYGVARLEANQVREIVENPARGKEPSNIRTVGAYFFKQDFFSYYAGLSHHHEADFIDAINWYLKEKTGSLVMLKGDVPALKYPWELFSVLDALFASSYFQPGVAPSARIGANVVMAGQVYVRENAVIKANCVIEGPAYIGPGCEIGYNNVLRGPVNLEQNIKTGAFCEIKHSIFQEGTHTHSGYFGNSIIGSNCRFGAGFVSANKRIDRGTVLCEVKGKRLDTRLQNLGFVAGSEARFGIHAGTMPGILVGSRAVVGPNTHVMENVPDNITVFAAPPLKKKK
ncbi:MAG: NTP transferase domain-containing protein [Parcubacteria group bacterium]|nr:NTP transferase domain-containing protein [Parcubacteria group bacterium]